MFNSDFGGLRDYRADWEPEGSNGLQIAYRGFGPDRSAALRFARRQSEKVGTVYVIASTEDGDIGQRVYTNGYFERQDDVF